MVNIIGKDHFENTRLLEIGPKDGLDSSRLASLKPAELVLVDLPEKQSLIEGWLHKIVCPYKFIEANMMYMSSEEFVSFGKFHPKHCRHSHGYSRCRTAASY